MPDEHYDNPALAALYDVENGWSPDRDFYLSLASGKPMSILDLGCGTGLLCNAYAADGHDVTGVEPSSAMLEIARSKPFGEKIEWVHGSAQTYRSAKRFDLVVMTGHAFQVLLNKSDVQATFETMRSHLKRDGIAVFETRNPAIDWASRWDQSYTFDTQDGPAVVTRRVTSISDGFVEFDTAYALKGGTLVSNSVLKFWNLSEIETIAAEAGLEVASIMGDWDGSGFDAEISGEMIFSVRIK